MEKERSYLRPIEEKQIRKVYDLKPIREEDKKEDERITQEMVVPKVVEEPKKIDERFTITPKKAEETIEFHYSGFLTFEENHVKLGDYYRAGWTLKSETRSTTDHIIILKK
jgi:hypothetical protein